MPSELRHQIINAVAYIVYSAFLTNIFLQSTASQHVASLYIYEQMKRIYLYCILL